MGKLGKQINMQVQIFTHFYLFIFQKQNKGDRILNIHIHVHK